MTIDCHVDGRALTFFQCEMLEDYAEQIAHGEGISLSEIIESGLELVEPGEMPTNDLDLTLWEEFAGDEDGRDERCGYCGDWHAAGSACPVAKNEACPETGIAPYYNCTCSHEEHHRR